MTAPHTKPESEQPYRPLHVIEGYRLPWERWFAWYPVRSEQGYRVWLRWTWRSRFFAALWFDPAPYGGYFQYSDERKDFWESRP